jgi:hypothetical protein
MTARWPKKRAIVNVSVVNGGDRGTNEGGMSR